MSQHSDLPIAILYEQQNWFKPLFAELDRRGTNYVKLSAVEHAYSPADHPEEKYSLVFNRVSPSAWNRGNGDQIFYTVGFLEHLEARGVRVINGLHAFRSELSKAGQLTLLEQLDLPYPKSRVIHRPSQAASATEGLRWPIVVKPNIGGSGAGVTRFDTLESLEAAAAANTLAFGLDSIALVQEFIPAQDAHIVRVEVLNGKFLYAIKVHITGETFDLCPADICRTTDGVLLDRAACAIDAPKSGITVEAYDPPAEVIADVERIMHHSGIDIGGVEYLTDSRHEEGEAGQRYYYDTNALSNFVADGPRVIGFDPFARLVDWLEAEAASVNETRLAEVTA
ncbi:ATP-grasp domain-containing protein [Granulicella arctica]|uniref:ATP-grasp domain-containing protein n=1 Tax=Granulicella arctica TaxID=940613 RepID=UPI0021E08F6A|nr:hypothetical protein [Granulicella arctica]